MNIYILYDPKDEHFLQQLQNHLAIWQRQKVITTYHEGNILAGSNAKHTIETQLNAADMVLLLISSDFVANNQQYKYAEQAITLQKTVVPILLRPCLWDGAIWEQLKPLPKQAISLYDDKDLAFYEVVTGLQKIIDLNYQVPNFETFQQDQQNNKANIYYQQADKIYNIDSIDEANFKTTLNLSNSKNVLVNSNLIVERDIHVGDNIINNPTPKIPHRLTTYLPKTDPKELIGRSEDLTKLHNLLNEQEEVVLVNAMGGLGKTTLAQAYIHQYEQKYKHIAWITQTNNELSTDFC